MADRVFCTLSLGGFVSVETLEGLIKVIEEEEGDTLALDDDWTCIEFEESSLDFERTEAYLKEHGVSYELWNGGCDGSIDAGTQVFIAPRYLYYEDGPPYDQWFPEDHTGAAVVPSLWLTGALNEGLTLQAVVDQWVKRRTLPELTIVETRETNEEPTNRS